MYERGRWAIKSSRKNRVATTITKEELLLRYKLMIRFLTQMLLNI